MVLRVMLIFVMAFCSASAFPDRIGTSYCVELTKGLNVSVSACWQSAIKMRTLIAKEMKWDPAVRTGDAICADVDDKLSIKEVGRYLLTAYRNLRCLVEANRKLLEVDAIAIFNDITMLMYEVIGNPKICLDMDSKGAECPKNMPQDIPEAISLMARTLENVFIRLGSNQV